MRIRKRIWIPGTILLLLGAFALVISSRYTVTREKDGWRWESSHARLGCPVCSGRMERLTCNKDPVPLPSGLAGGFQLFTPVGHARYHGGQGGYQPYSIGETELPNSDVEISPEDLTRGYYDLRGPTASTRPGATGEPSAVGGRKIGTPAHWCFGTSGDYDRWLDPALIDDLDW